MDATKERLETDECGMDGDSFRPASWLLISGLGRLRPLDYRGGAFIIGLHVKARNAEKSEAGPAPAVRRAVA
jgi:hypothetical protein